MPKIKQEETTYRKETKRYVIEYKGKEYVVFHYETHDTQFGDFDDEWEVYDPITKVEIELEDEAFEEITTFIIEG